MNLSKLRIAAFLLCAASQAIWAQAVTVKDAWARATVQGQQATGVFMQLTSPADARLVGVSSPVAGVAEVHEMKMEGQVMKMRAVQGGLALPAGTPVALQPGGYHIMLMDLKLPVQKDTTIALTLVLRDAAGSESRLGLQVPVLVRAPAPMAR